MAKSFLPIGYDHKRPLLSVITPVKNGANWISKCISTVAAIPIPFEHIIVDGYSSDATRKVVSSLGEHCITINESMPGAGMYSAINDGINVSCGKYIAYLNCDDRYLPASLAKAIILAERNSFDLLVCSGIIDNQDSFSYFRTKVPLFPSFFLRNAVIPTVQPSIIFSRRAYDRNPFDTSLKIIGDLDLFMRISLDTGCKLGSFADPVSIFTIHRESLGSTSQQLHKVEMAKVKHLSYFKRIVLKFLRIF